MVGLNSPENEADELAGACLDYLVADPSRLADFMAAAGIGPDQLRSRARTGELAHGLLDWFAHNEAALTGLCESAGLEPETVMRAYYRLNPGG